MARRAALFGCNYAGTKSELHGCINDVRAVHEMLVYAYQFDPQVGKLASLMRICTCSQETRCPIDCCAIGHLDKLVFMYRRRTSR